MTLSTDIEILRDIERGQIKHALFDFDGTISLLREGWQDIMQPVCVEMIAGIDAHHAIAEIEVEVAAMIEETTGIQTIFQMERLADMVRARGIVPQERVLSPAEYKQVYNERLMVPVRDRITRLERGELKREDVMVSGVDNFLQLLRDRGVTLYVFSGTDQDDVRNEAAKLGVAHYFAEIWGALPSVEEYSKEKVIRELITRHNLHGPEVMAVGDGPVEIRNIKEHGGIALGVCSNEKTGRGWDNSKRPRLTKAGADVLVADFQEAPLIEAVLFGTAQ